MFSVIFGRHLAYRKLLFCSSRIKYDCKKFSNDASVKKFRLVKRLASTLLFGGTFLIVVWAKRRKQSTFFNDAKFVNNAFYNDNFKLYEYKAFVLPSFVMKNLSDIQNFSCRENDIFVVSFPKTGTTWLQEIIYCTIYGIDNSLTKSIEDRFPYLEFVYPGLSSIEKITDQRLIKTHLPLSLLPKDVQLKKPKIFYITRNPKDVIVSYYHFVRMMTISNYSVPYGPIWRHYKEVWEIKNESNICILSYEDLHWDINGSIKKIANYLGKDLTDSEVDAIANHCSFQNMSQNPNVNYQHWDDLGIRNKNEAKFMRKGEIGDWKNYFTSEMNQAMSSWIDENMKNIHIFYDDSLKS
ncbi:amine sulfotransferase isoform X1 [Parasteatoda tepidariorum]|uniref:amine sulfotransferase isoform X1 n=1 Tax=Parasteatoda tepidariorum TaxID=114398 RepID=UPI00077F9FC5|nr:amine sulfotransferase isoform X2 [Parasteatoda tepidariorum]